MRRRGEGSAGDEEEEEPGEAGDSREGEAAGHLQHPHRTRTSHPVRDSRQPRLYQSRPQ